MGNLYVEVLVQCVQRRQSNWPCIYGISYSREEGKSSLPSIILEATEYRESIGYLPDNHHPPESQASRVILFTLCNT